MTHELTRRPARGRRLLTAAATLCLALGLSAVVGLTSAVAVTPVPVPGAEKPTSGDVTATVSMYQEDDVFELSPGMDYSASMAWWSTKEEGDRTPSLTSLSGKGTFNAAVDATLIYPLDTVCGNWHYKLAANGAVDSLSSLNFSFEAKDINRPGLGLKGWIIHTPIAQWKGQLEVQKNAPCDTSTQDGGASFDGVTFVGGTKTGGTPIAAPRVTMTKGGGVTISGQGIVASATKRQVVRFSISCGQFENCFGYEDGDNGLEHGWKFRGATCEKGPGGTVRLRVKMRMNVRNGDGLRNWARGMRADARLVPTKGGLNFHRAWSGGSAGGLVQSTRYTRDFEFVTDNVSANGDWALELKYTWDRALDRDVVEQIKGRTPSCMDDPAFAGA